MRLSISPLLALALALATPALLLGAGAAAAEAPSAGASYRLVATATPEALAQGGSGKIVLAVEPVGQAHVDPRAPVKVELESSPGLALPRRRLARGDAAGGAPGGIRFEVPFQAVARGRQEVRARLDFFVCTADLCLKQRRDAALRVEVR